MMRNVWALCAIPLFAVGCTSTDSTFVETDEIWADLAATATGNGQTEVTATLRDGGPNSLTFVDLEGGDVLRAILSTGGTDITEVMTEHQALGITSYSADFGTEAEDTEFRIEFDRETEISALGSSVTLPSPFILSAYPTSSTDSFYRGANAPDVGVEWTPFDFTTGDILSYEVTGTCIQTFQGNIDWTTDDALQVSATALTDSNPAGQTCQVTIAITLTRPGTVDSAFGGGAFSGVQVRTLNMTSEPCTIAACPP